MTDEKGMERETKQVLSTPTTERKSQPLVTGVKKSQAVPKDTEKRES